MDWINVVFWLVGTLVVVLGPIVLIHELGHFIFAKLGGVRVEEFGFGFPPRMLKLWRGKGYLNVGSTRVIVPAFFRLPGGLAVGAWVDAVAERRDDGNYYLHRLTTLDPAVDDLRPRREIVDEGVRMRGEVTALEPGTLYSLNWLPMGAFVRMTGEEDPSDPRSLAAQPKRWRVAVLAAGAVLNLIVAVVLITGAYTSGFPEKWVVEVNQVELGGAAEEAGIQSGDVVLAARGTHIAGESYADGMAQLRDIIRAVPEQTIDLTILRGDKTLSLAATPSRTPEGYGLLGILMAPWPDRSALRYHSVPEALGAGVTDIVETIKMMLQLPGRLAQGEVSVEEARPASMVGISGILAFSLQQSIAWGLAFPVLHTASLVSLALGLTNLLPLPALDGGRILFVLIEAVRGRRLSPELEAMVHMVGLVVLVSLMAFVMFQDLVNPVIPWSWLVR
jgi:regulator of sigma E protease